MQGREIVFTSMLTHVDNFHRSQNSALGVFALAELVESFHSRFSSLVLAQLQIKLVSGQVTRRIVSRLERERGR